MKAILIVYFGTPLREQQEKVFDTMTWEVSEAFPEYKIYTAFSSEFIVKKLYSQGIEVDNLQSAFERMASDGIEKVFVAPIIFIDGREYDYICETAKQFKGNFRKIKIGSPLLSSSSRRNKVTHILMDFFRAEYPDRDVVFMGHGTEHKANEVYEKLYVNFLEEGFLNSHMGLVEAKPGLDEVIGSLEDTGNKKLVLTPLMLVAGDHANNDMAGEGGWAEQLTEKGFDVLPLIKGMGEYKQIRDIFLNHIKKKLIFF